jgi:hypothetical protein
VTGSPGYIERRSDVRQVEMRDRDFLAARFEEQRRQLWRIDYLGTVDEADGSSIAESAGSTASVARRAGPAAR